MSLLPGNNILALPMMVPFEWARDRLMDSLPWDLDVLRHKTIR